MTAVTRATVPSQSGSMEASYEIDTLRLVTMSFGLWGGGNKSNGSTDYIATFPENINAAPIYSYSAFNRSKSYGIPSMEVSTTSVCSR